MEEQGKTRVRFAPSPTGFLHVGGARTALYNWLFTRHYGGSYILRIEDTDQTRSTQEAIEAIISSLKWLGLDWNEGPDVGGTFGPYRQTQRLKLYQEAIEKILAQKQAYYCYCTSEELKKRREEAAKKGESPAYNRRCRYLSQKEQVQFEAEGRKPVVRLASPLEGITIVDDLIRGRISFENKDLDDYILLRSDKTPTYNLAVVVDDALMKISHVIRGEDHLSNTPRQIILYKALNLPIPKFAHLPMILGSDKKPLSKRHGATSVEEFQEKGYLPEAMVNYLALLGWSYDDKTTIFSREELIEKFSLERVSKNPAIWDLGKLEWMNGYYIRQMKISQLTPKVIFFLQRKGLLEKDITKSRQKWLEKVVSLCQERAKTLGEVEGLTDFFFKDKVELEIEAVEKVMKKDAVPQILKLALEKLSVVEKFQAETIEKNLRDLVKKLNLKAKDVFQPIRVAVTGKRVSTPLFETLELIGKDRSLERLNDAITRFS